MMSLCSPCVNIVDTLYEQAELMDTRTRVFGEMQSYPELIRPRLRLLTRSIPSVVVAKKIRGVEPRQRAGNWEQNTWNKVENRTTLGDEGRLK
jgi:hypothetical protein